MSNTEKPGNQVPIPDRYPPGNDDRATVAAEIPDVLGPTRSTFTARDIADRTPYCSTKVGQILVAMAETPDASDCIQIEQTNDRQANNRYREATPEVER